MPHRKCLAGFFRFSGTADRAYYTVARTRIRADPRGGTEVDSHRAQVARNFVRPVQSRPLRALRKDPRQQENIYGDGRVERGAEAERARGPRVVIADPERHA